MEKTDLFDLIESFLNNALPDDKRQEVEQRIAEDETFRQEVALHQELQENFSDPGRLRLRSAMADILEEPLPPSESPGTGSFNSWWKGAALLAVALLVGFGIWQWRESPAAPDVPGSGEKQPTELPAAPSREEPATIPEEIPLKPPTSEPSKEKAPIAQADPANFIPNPGMEAFVGSGSRSGNLDVKIISPLNGTYFVPSKKGEVLIRFAGTAKGTSEGAPGASVLAVFNNRDANKSLFSMPLELRKDSDRWAFEVQQQLKFQPGLYYFTVEQEGEMEYAGKFTIGKHDK